MWKPRTRQAWAEYRDDLYNVEIDATWQAEYGRQLRGEESRVFYLPTGDLTVPRVGGAAPAEPAGSTEAAGRRRELADRLFGALVKPMERGVFHGDDDVVLSTGMPASVDEAPGARQALQDAPSAAKAGKPGTLRVESGTGGIVVRLHGPTWSLVFRYAPFPSPVLVCVDRLSGYCWRLEDDSEDRALVENAITGVIAELARFGWAGDRYVRPVIPGA